MSDTEEVVDVLDTKTVIEGECDVMRDLIKELDSNIELLQEKKERLEIVLTQLGKAIENQMDLNLSDST
tara:strand:+ start:740 stop:946 length:207 start_codon:yes stop_codon:yes gene_type:complete